MALTHLTLSISDEKVPPEFNGCAFLTPFLSSQEVLRYEALQIGVDWLVSRRRGPITGGLPQSLA